MRADLAADGPVYPFGAREPGAGELIEIVPGVRWWRVPMPGPLKHVNGFILADGDARAVAVDTGIAGPESTEAWRTLLAGPLAGTRIARVICTHMHPDHIGLAGWLCRKFDAALVMTRTEWLTARMLTADVREETPPEMLAFWRGAGWDDAQVAQATARGWGRFAGMISRLPPSFVQIRDGDTVDVGGARWEVVVGSGHSPEHACLLDRERRILISGDQVLPRISSNISLSVSEPEGDPLGEWFASIARFRRLPDDLLVLPGHGKPFHGLHARLDALDMEHRDRLDDIEVALAQAPLRAVDCFALLFRRPIGPDVIGMATGEALAHLRRLEATGRARREVRDGIWWWHPA